MITSDPEPGLPVRARGPGRLWLATLGALTIGAAAAQQASDPRLEVPAGEALYASECLTCHMRDGRGVPGMSPPLLDSPWILGSADALIGFVLTGGFGPDALMASFAYLSDAELAELLTYVRTQFGGEANPISAEAVARARATFIGQGADAPQ